MGRSRVGGLLAIALSAIWAVGGAATTVVGVLLIVSGRDSDVDFEGYLSFFGAAALVVGGVILAAAIAGIVVGVKMRRGSGRSRAAPVVLFGLFGAASGMFLASALADETGVDPGGVALFGVNTGLCILIVAIALFGARR